MENLFARLLQEYESGQLNRRQLLQSLVVAASAAATTGHPGGKGFQATGVNHISYQVRDYRVTRDFYADLLGMTVSGDDGKQQCNLNFGNTWLLPRNRRSDTPDPGRGVVDHIGYTISNWDQKAVFAELQRRGLHAKGMADPRGDTPNSFHIVDPDNFDLQIAGEGMRSGVKRPR